MASINAQNDSCHLYHPKSSKTPIFWMMKNHPKYADSKRLTAEK
jgi:hypothetical protein